MSQALKTTNSNHVPARHPLTEHPVTTTQRSTTDRRAETVRFGREVDKDSPDQVRELVPLTGNARPAQDKYGSGRSRPVRRRLLSRLTKLVTVTAMSLVMLGVGVGGASSASALTIGTACSEQYWSAAYWSNVPEYGGWVIVDVYYTPCVTGNFYNVNVRGTNLWWLIR